jgi:hypothetical protein
MGRGITALQELLTDSHLEGVWSMRCSAANDAQWFCSAAGDSAREKETARVFAEQLGSLDIPRIIEEMMDAVAYGYSPLEIIWLPDNGRWGIGDIVGKPFDSPAPAQLRKPLGGQSFFKMLLADDVQEKRIPLVDGVRGKIRRRFYVRKISWQC